MLPKTFPIAKLGALIQAALELEEISGKEVTKGIRAAPIQSLPNPVFSAIISPYLVSLVPTKIIIREHNKNKSHKLSKCISDPPC
jgi:hypothetical protein